MTSIAKLEFLALKNSGENYMPWTANIKRHLMSMGVLETIAEGNACDEQDKATAAVFIHKHIDEILQLEYFNSDDPSVLWKNLKSRFDHQRDSLLPMAKADWDSLRFQDFKSVNDYTSALLKLCSRFDFCGQPKTEEEKLEKTFSTFHASQINLQQSYRLQNHKTYAELNMILIIQEKNNELLMKNHQARPTGSLTIPEANIAYNNDHNNYGRKWEQGRGQGRGRGRGRGRNNVDRTHFSGRNHSFKWKNNRGRGRGRGKRTNNYHAPQNNNCNQQHKARNEAGTSTNNESSCFRCGSANHWAKTCRTPSHLCQLYQASLKKEEKEVNHINNIDNVNTELNPIEDFDNVNTDLNNSDFFELEP